MANNIQNPFGKLTNYVLNPQQEDDKQPQVQQPTQYAQAATLQQPQPQTIQPRQQPAPQMFGQPQQPQPAQPRQTTMTPVTAGQRYTQMLQQNVPQAQAVASGLAQQVTAPAAAAQRGFEEAQKEFAKRVAEKKLTTPVARTQELVSKAARGEELTPEELAELQKVSTAREGFEEGTRPEDFAAFQSYVTALGEAQKAKQYAGLVGTAGGRQQLLQQATKAPGYTSGQAMLDALLAGGVAPAAEQLQQITQRYGAADELGLAQQRMAEEALRTKEAGKEEVESSYRRLQDLLDAEGTGELAKLEKAIQDRVTQANINVKETNKLIDDVVPNIGTVFGDTDDEKKLMTLLGIDPTTKEGEQLIRNIEFAPKDINLISKLKEVNPQTAASEKERKALRELYKIGDIVRRGKPELAIEEREDLGTLADQKIGLDKEKLASSAETKKATVLSDVDTAKQNITSSASNYKLAPGLSFGAALDDANERLIKRAKQGTLYPSKFSMTEYMGETAKEVNKLLSRAEAEIQNLNQQYAQTGYKILKNGKYVTPKLTNAVSKEEVDNYINQLVRDSQTTFNKKESYKKQLVEESKKSPGYREFAEKMLRLNKARLILKNKAKFDYTYSV